MKNIYRYIIYAIILLAFIIGAVLFFLRNEAVDFLRGSLGLIYTEAPVKVSVTASKDLVDAEIIKSPKLLALKNNVVTFDFNSICKTAVGEIEIVSTSTFGEVVTTTKKITCLLGNGNPFPLTVNKDQK